MRTIASQWESFKAAACPPGASAAQLQEFRRALYAGAQAMLGITWGIGEDKVSEAAGVAILHGLHVEASQFALDVAEGRA